MAVGACDAYFADAYADLISRAIRAKELQTAIDIPDRNKVKPLSVASAPTDAAPAAVPPVGLLVLLVLVLVVLVLVVLVVLVLVVAAVVVGL